jgi:hypothetical protein
MNNRGVGYRFVNSSYRKIRIKMILCVFPLFECVISNFLRPGFTSLRNIIKFYMPVCSQLQQGCCRLCRPFSSLIPSPHNQLRITHSSTQIILFSLDLPSVPYPTRHVQLYYPLNSHGFPGFDGRGSREAEIR